MRDFIAYWVDVILDILCGERTKPKRKRKSKEWYYVDEDDAETIPLPPEPDPTITPTTMKGNYPMKHKPRGRTGQRSQDDYFGDREGGGRTSAK